MEVPAEGGPQRKAGPTHSAVVLQVEGLRRRGARWWEDGVQMDTLAPEYRAVPWGFRDGTDDAAATHTAAGRC